MRFMLIFILIYSSVFGVDNIINEKNCEKVQLSERTDLISCSGRDYLVEYTAEDELRDEGRGEVYKVTAITSSEVKIILSK